MQPGQPITPTIRLVRLLGQGGMGSVWVAEHLALSSHVAVKFMSPQYVQNQELVQRFRTEAVAAAQIKSPHIAQVFDHGFMSDGAPYIVMELLEGEDVRRRVQREGPLPLRDVASIVHQTAKALGRAHQIGIVHRDIKPDNLFLCNSDGDIFVKVLDFGIAKLDRDGHLGVTATGSMVGTPFYMSPEQILSSKHVDLRTDLWSLAVVVYHALTGHVPFTGETLGSVAVAINSGSFVAPSKVRVDLPPAVDVWFQRALHREPERRFGSAKELAETLEVALLGQATTRAMMSSAYDAVMSEPPSAGGGAVSSGQSSSLGPLITPGTEPGSTLARAALARTTKGAAGRARLMIGLVACSILTVLGLFFFLRTTRAGREEEARIVPAVSAVAPPASTGENQGPVIQPAPSASTAEASAAEAPAPGMTAPRSQASAKSTKVPTQSTAAATTKPPSGGAKPKDTIGF